jgi:glycosyltransferase involved in cell wall biosynthesis
MKVKMQALDADAQRSLSKIGHADIVIGIPSYNSESTISHVITQCAEGLRHYFAGFRSAILISDGGSTDGTLRIAERIRMPQAVSLISCNYQGVPGKGSAVKAILEAAVTLDARSLAMVDSDLRSITPSWVKLLVQPTLGRAALVTPRYDRDKYDGTITNQICYPLVRALYGKRIRQPIGGDFGLSTKLAENLIESPLWETPYVPRFGIDIFVTSSALANGFVVEEADLGVKIHESKDPGLQLASMFREVSGSTFACMQRYEKSWKEIRRSSPVPLHRNEIVRTAPPRVHVDIDRLTKESKTLYSKSEQFRSALSSDLRRELDSGILAAPHGLDVPTNSWTRTVYEVSALFKTTEESTRDWVLDGFRAVWSARIATFVRCTTLMSNEETERKVEEDAAHFEETKSELARSY